MHYFYTTLIITSDFNIIPIKRLGGMISIVYAAYNVISDQTVIFSSEHLLACSRVILPSTCMPCNAGHYSDNTNASCNRLSFSMVNTTETFHIIWRKAYLQKKVKIYLIQHVHASAFSYFQISVEE